MLGKLIKYELKATGRVFLPFFLSLIVFALVTKFFSGFNPQTRNTTTAIISTIIYISMMAGMFIMTFLMMIQRFIRNLLSDEGYLMHTLPVKPWSHIVSKLLVSMLWTIASVIIALLSVLVIAAKNGVITSGVQGFATLHNQFNQFYAQWGALTFLITLEVILGVLISLASGILLIYCSIAIGHLFGRHKILASFGAFLVLNTLTQIYFAFAGVLPRIIHFSPHTGDDFVTYQLIFCYGLIFTGILASVYFALTNFILTKRLNLE